MRGGVIPRQNGISA